MLLKKELCYDSHCRFCCSIRISWEEKKMSIIATVASVGTAIAALTFALWMVSQTFKKD
jgi:hypothetical protein